MLRHLSRLGRLLKSIMISINSASTRINMRPLSVSPPSIHKLSTRARYAFPLYSTWSKVTKCAPELMRDTWLVPVSCISLDSSVSRSNFSIALVRINSQIIPWGRFLNVTCDAINAWEYFVEWSSVQQLDSSQQLDFNSFGVPSVLLREWIERWENSRLRFRGLRALYVPR